MIRKAPISTIMTEHVITLHKKDSLEKAEQIFKRHNIRHIPIVTNNVVIGMLSKTDLLRLKFSDYGEAENLDCIIKDVQFDPVTEKIVHIDLLGLQKGEKIQIEVPVQFIGTPIGLKEGGVLQHSLHKIEIKCLPAEIPEHIEVDVTNLKLGDAIHISDLKFDNFEIVNSEEVIVASVTHPRIEKEETPAEVEEVTEPEVIAKGKTEEKEEE